MSQAVRGIVAVLLGLGFALAITYLVDWVNLRMYPLPTGADLADPASMKAAMATLPRAALAIALGGWFVSALAGACAAAGVARPAGWPPLAVGVTLFAIAVANMQMLRRPVWFWIIGVAIYPVATWLGARLGGTPVKRRG
jgi:hypothetical protein